MESLAQLPGPPYFRTLHMSAEAISTSGRKACELLKMAPGPKIPGRPAAVQLAAFLKSGSIQTNPPSPFHFTGSQTHPIKREHAKH
jgi:hypothetical protein